MKSYHSFIQFLLENNCQKEFNEAFQSQAPGYRMDVNLWEILGGDEYIFGRIFDWEHTPQGREFWAKIDEKWYSFSTSI